MPSFLKALHPSFCMIVVAGVDCIDCSADPAVVAAVNEGVDVAMAIGQSGIPGQHVTSRPWIMVSINDDDDPHFRKAHFDPKVRPSLPSIECAEAASRANASTRCSQVCPPDCKRPCESVCPADAISDGGVSDAKCYGCGRCLPACPLGLIIADSYQRTPLEVTSSLSGSRVDAVEIHTAGRGLIQLPFSFSFISSPFSLLFSPFSLTFSLPYSLPLSLSLSLPLSLPPSLPLSSTHLGALLDLAGTDRLDILWEGIGSWARSLKLVAVSFPDPGGDDLA